MFCNTTAKQLQYDCSMSFGCTARIVCTFVSLFGIEEASFDLTDSWSAGVALER